jgi:hypothetical protein
VCRGYVVITIDALMFGEGRALLDVDLTYGWDCSRYSPDDVKHLNQQCRAKEATLVKALVLAGATWPGIKCRTTPSPGWTCTWPTQAVDPFRGEAIREGSLWTSRCPPGKSDPRGNDPLLEFPDTELVGRYFPAGLRPASKLS